MAENVWVEIRNVSGALVTVAKVIEGSWGLEMIGGCGAGRFTLAREWHDVADLEAGSEVRAMVDGETWWVGILERANIADEQFPTIDCAGYRERLRRLGSYHREWTTIDKGTTQDPPSLDLSEDVGADVLTRLTGLFPDLTSSRVLTTRPISYASLDGDGYGALDSLIQLYGGDAIWGVDEAKVLYLKDFPSAPAPNMRFLYGRDFRLAFARDDSGIVNRIVLVGQDKEPKLITPAKWHDPQSLMQMTPGYWVRAKVNPAWNLLPNASFEVRRADVESQFYPGLIPPYNYDNYSWVGIKASMTGEVQYGFPTIRGSAYDPTADPGKAGETAIRFEMWNPAATNYQPPCTASISTAFGEVSAPNANEDTRVPVVGGTDIRLTAAVYKNASAVSVTAGWRVRDYNSTDGIVATHNSPYLELADNWNTWATSQGGGGTSQGVGTDLSYTATLANTAAKVGVELRLYLNVLATSQVVYVDAWQLQTTSQSQSFSPVAAAVEQYDVEADYMNMEEPEITLSKADYGLHFAQVRAPFKDQRYANEADGLRYARGFFYNAAVPMSSGTLELMREPEFYRPWDGLVRLHGLPSAIEDILRRFDSETYVDLQAERVEYTWDGALRGTIYFANKKRIIPVAERGILDTPPPPERKAAWRDYLDQISRASPGPHRHGDPRR